VLLEVLVVVSWPTVVVVVVVLVVVGSRVVEVEGAAVVVVGRTVGLGVGTARRRARVVEEIPATRPRGRRVVGAAASLEGPSCCLVASPDGPGAVTTPSTLPPVAPSTTATTSIAHRRSSLNRIHAPACASGFH
jgi:hypothetical protein